MFVIRSGEVEAIHITLFQAATKSWTNFFVGIRAAANFRQGHYHAAEAELRSPIPHIEREQCRARNIRDGFREAGRRCAAATR